MGDGTVTASPNAVSRDRRFCGRPTRQREGNCERPAGWGTDHPGDGPCKLHGGSLPVVRAKAKERILEAEVRGELTQRGWGQVTDPLGAFADLAGEILAFKELCREQINALSVWVGFDKDEMEYARALVVVYERALDRSAKTLVDMLRLGLDAQALRQAKERPTREQAEAFSRILDHLLADLALTDDQRARVPAALAAAISKEGLLP